MCFSEVKETVSNQQYFPTLTTGNHGLGPPMTSHPPAARLLPEEEAESPWDQQEERGVPELRKGLAQRKQDWVMPPPGLTPCPRHPTEWELAMQVIKVDPQERRSLSHPHNRNMEGGLEGVFFSEGRKFLKFLGGKSKSAPILCST